MKICLLLVEAVENEVRQAEDTAIGVGGAVNRNNIIMLCTISFILCHIILLLLCYTILIKKNIR